MKYGQHETFHLRLNWLRKGIKMIQQNPRFFFEKDAAEKIGLGKNMVQSLRFWITASNIAKEEKENNVKSIHVLTDFGKLINQFDPHLDLSDSLSLLHYYLINKDASKERLFVWYGLFNIISRTSITKEEIVSEVADWAANEGEQTSENSLKRDVDCLCRLYFKEKNSKDPEDVTQSPLGKLGLLSSSNENSNIIIKNQSSYRNIGLIALMYILLKYGEMNETDNVSVEEIESKPGLWGKLFNLSRIESVSALDELSQHFYFPIQFNRSSRLDTVILPKVSADDYLKHEYDRRVGDLDEKAAI